MSDLTSKKDKLFKFIIEWEKKDYDEFNGNFEGFVEKLNLSYDDAKEISDALDTESYKDSTPNSGSAHMQYAADFFVMILEDYDRNNNSDDSRKYLIND